MRAVLDVDVIISALLTPAGSPAKVLRLWLDGAFDLVVSATLLDELERALAYPKLRARIDATESRELIELLSRSADVVDDPRDAPSVRSADPDDDYLVELAAVARAVIVSGDRHLLDLAGQIPVYAAAQFLNMLDETR